MGATITASSKSTALENVRKALELELVLGRLKPRERLIEDELMDRFDSKRHVIRSVLAELESNGLVERRPNKGAVVKEYSREEVEEIYDFRADLHRLAVARMSLPFPIKVLKNLRGLADRHEKAIARRDLAEVILCNNAFHDLLFDQCGNRFLAESIRQLGSTANAIRSYRVNEPDLLRQAAAEHRMMIEAIENGDLEGLSELSVRHIMPSKEIYLRNIGMEWNT